MVAAGGYIGIILTSCRSAAAPVATPAPTAAPTKVPKTGDSANPLLWLGAVLAGLTGIGLYMNKSRRKGR